MDKYVVINRANWESRVGFHVALQSYGVDRFVSDPSHLSGVVTFDKPRLGDISGRDVIHLQCHIGTDTLSLARLGAQVTGLDFSPTALSAARRLAATCEQPVRFVEAELYDAPAVLGSNRFDLVYTGIGALCWLPDIRRWASVVAALLRPGGRLFIREAHPMLETLADSRPDGLLCVEYPYFEVNGGTKVVETKTYVDHDGEVGAPDSIIFNHGLGEIITALLRVGMELIAFEEHDSVPWAALGDQMVENRGEFRLRDRPNRLAASYTLQAVKH